MGTITSDLDNGPLVLFKPMETFLIFLNFCNRAYIYRGSHIKKNHFMTFYYRWGTKDMSSISSGLDSGPLVLFKPGGDTLVISPFSSFMASSAVYDTKASTASWGLIGTMKSVPKGFHYWTVAFYCPGGINMVSIISSNNYCYSKIFSKTINYYLPPTKYR